VNDKQRDSTLTLHKQHSKKDIFIGFKQRIDLMKLTAINAKPFSKSHFTYNLMCCLCNDRVESTMWWHGCRTNISYW